MKIAVSFGANLGDRAQTILLALKEIGELVSITAVSGLFETDPLYEIDQPPFLNGVFVAETELGAKDLVGHFKMIESSLGRVDRSRNDPREIDLDLITHDAGSDAPSVAVPHPRAHERRFVLEPMNEIAPDWVIPGRGVVRDLLANPDVQKQGVRRVADAPVSL